jgi:5'-methylthioadenosine phosphorylase
VGEWVLGVVGGSGLYEIDGLKNQRWVKIDTPWGDPSDELLMGELDGVKLVFLPRHGRGHRIPPSGLNFRANIDALKRAGCTDILSLSAVGSLREALNPGTFVVVDQFIDRTFARTKSFFGEGLVAHVSMAHPTCPRLSSLAAEAARAAGARVIEGGTYLAMEGPQFSTKAESLVYRSWGCDVIGMTNMPEAKLAREAELPYASIGMVTDYDGWHEEFAPVEVAGAGFVGSGQVCVVSRLGARKPAQGGPQSVAKAHVAEHQMAVHLSMSGDIEKSIRVYFVAKLE